MRSKSNSIGVFDSGVGGLSVLKELMKVLPNENFEYIGDTKRMPYGVRSPKEIEDFTYECIEILVKKDIKAIVLACNTATSFAFSHIKKNFNMPIVGVVEPTCSYVSKLTLNKKVALLATDGTVLSKIYDRTISQIDPEINLESVAAPNLVLDIERGNLDNLRVKNTINSYLSKLKFDYDTLILGCTHFPLAIDTFVEIFKEEDRDVAIVDPAIETAMELKKILEKENLLNNETKPFVNFHVTGNLEAFKVVANNVIFEDIKKDFIKENQI